MGEKLRYEYFAPHFETIFEIEYQPETRLAVRLSDATMFPQVTATGHAFRLLFQSELREYLPQGNYRFFHESLGELILFMVPLGPNEHGMRYEVIFNYLS